MGYLYWLRVKNSNHLHTELSLGYLKGTKLYLKSKASFIHISSIASFTPFFIAWLWEYCTFSDNFVVSPRLGQKTPSTELFSKKKNSCSTMKLFLFFKYVLYWTVVSKYLKKIGGQCARMRENEHLFRYRAKFEGSLLRLYAHVLMCAR